MKPRFATETGRWSNTQNDYECYGFNIKYDNIEKWEILTIKVKNRVAIGYLINNKSAECNEQSWPNALINAVNKNDYNINRPKKFELIQTDGQYCYALTDATKQKIMKEHEWQVNCLMQDFPDGFSIINPNMEPGDTFKDEEPQFQSGLSFK